MGALARYETQNSTDFFQQREVLTEVWSHSIRLNLIGMDWKIIADDCIRLFNNCKLQTCKQILSMLRMSAVRTLTYRLPLWHVLHAFACEMALDWQWNQSSSRSVSPTFFILAIDTLSWVDSMKIVWHQANTRVIKYIGKLLVHVWSGRDCVFRRS